MKLKFIISGGGTGGHIFPAIAIANELKSRFADAEFLFVGAENRMEMERVPQAGYQIEGLPIAGIQRKLSLKNLTLPFKLVASLLKSKRIIQSFRPDVAIGTGGYASAPLLRSAAKNGIPCLIQEQNSYAGITNKWLAKSVQTICVAYEGMNVFFPAEKIRYTGNPVRHDLLETGKKRSEGVAFFKLNPNKKTLLVLGGSLGAGAINNLIEKSLPLFEKLNLQIIWQCGKYYFDAYKRYENESVHVLPFIEKMDVAYGAADFIISRSGALSVSELCLVGKPVVFIPSPNVAEDHQTKNAEAIVNRKAALLIPEKNLESDFEKEFSSLVASEGKQKELAENIKTLARPHATKDIVDEIEKLIQKKKL